MDGLQLIHLPSLPAESATIVFSDHPGLITQPFASAAEAVDSATEQVFELQTVFVLSIPSEPIEELSGAVVTSLSLAEEGLDIAGRRLRRIRRRRQLSRRPRLLRNRPA